MSQFIQNNIQNVLYEHKKVCFKIQYIPYIPYTVLQHRFSTSTKSMVATQYIPYTVLQLSYHVKQCVAKICHVA